MRANSPKKRTNVRFLHRDAAPAAIAWALWAALAAALQSTGALERWAEDVTALGALACAFAVVAYFADTEVRAALELPPAWLAVALCVAAAAAPMSAAALLAFSPVAPLCAAALAAHAARAIRSARASSPAARRGAL